MIAGVDRQAIEELFAYTDYTRGEYADAVKRLGPEALTKPAPGSGWPALRDALGHINWSYQRWLSDPAGTTPGSFEAVSVNSWDDLDSYRLEVRTRFREYLGSLSDDELTTTREMNVDGEILPYSPADIFAHVLLHELRHHGDINTLFYQLGARGRWWNTGFSCRRRHTRAPDGLREVVDRSWCGCHSGCRERSDHAFVGFE